MVLHSLLTQELLVAPLWVIRTVRRSTTLPPTFFAAVLVLLLTVTMWPRWSSVNLSCTDWTPTAKTESKWLLLVCPSMPSSMVVMSAHTSLLVGMMWRDPNLLRSPTMETCTLSPTLLSVLARSLRWQSWSLSIRKIWLKKRLSGQWSLQLRAVSTTTWAQAQMWMCVWSRKVRLSICATWNTITTNSMRSLRATSLRQRDAKCWMNLSTSLKLPLPPSPCSWID